MISIMSVLYHRSYRKLLVFCSVLLLVSLFLLYQRPSSQTVPYPLSDLSLMETHRYSDDDTIVVDVDILKCISKSCKVPPGFRKIQPALNPPRGLSFNFNYYLIVKTEHINKATYILTELSVGEGSTTEPFKISKKFSVVNSENPIPPDLALIRDIEVLLGSVDLVDSRPHRKTIHLCDTPKVHAVLSVMRTTATEHAQYLEYWRQWTQLKNSQQIVHTLSRFKIMQISDLHFGNSPGRCVDNSDCSSDFRSIKFVEHSLDAEEPDLVVITGDILDTERTMDYKSVILKALQPILQHGTKFIYTFGDELNNSKVDLKTRIKILQFLDTIPQCLNSADYDSDLHGLTNHNLRVIKDTKSASITILDTTDKQLADSQINYLYRTSKNNNNALFQLLFFHYPIPQFRPVGKFKIVGNYNEKHKLETASKVKFHDDIMSLGYNVISVGHEHENDACILSAKDDHEMWLCYSGVTGDSGQTNLDPKYSRKLRLFEVDFDQQQLLSWKRREVDRSSFDMQLIASKKTEKVPA